MGGQCLQVEQLSVPSPLPGLMSDWHVWFSFPLLRAGDPVEGFRPMSVLLAQCQPVAHLRKGLSQGPSAGRVAKEPVATEDPGPWGQKGCTCQSTELGQAVSARAAGVSCEGSSGGQARAQRLSAGGRGCGLRGHHARW